MSKQKTKKAKHRKRWRRWGLLPVVQLTQSGGEVTNPDRAEWVRAALEVFARSTNQIREDGSFDSDWSEIVGDFLADLGHFCDHYTKAQEGGLHLAELIENGRHHYAAETDNEGRQFEDMT